ncbi:hypothetical protein [Yunchengibacter salinarum]|uniref:hypothetical protein n=1 Tax=Yunchengibacter salinarum TaxID=3133399 RepID=UPI0035B6A18E
MSVRLSALMLLALLLAACNKNPLEVVVSRCPAVAVVGDAGTMTRFVDNEPSASNEIFTASIMGVTSQCDQGDDVDASVSFEIAATAGPAMEGRTITVPYFVAVVKDNARIVSKKRFETVLTFDGKGRATAKQTVRQHIPTIEQARRYDYEVLLGFQLNPQEAVFNMQR